MIQLSLQSSEVHVKAGQSLGFSSSKVLRTLGGRFLELWQSMTEEGVKHGQNSVTYSMDGPND